MPSLPGAFASAPASGPTLSAGPAWPGAGSSGPGGRRRRLQQLPVAAAAATVRQEQQEQLLLLFLAPTCLLVGSSGLLQRILVFLAPHALLQQPLLLLLCVLSLRLQGLLALLLLSGCAAELLEAVARGLCCGGWGGRMLLHQASPGAHVLDFYQDCQEKYQ